MKRNYSRDGLLKTYQQEATNIRDQRLIEKQSRILEERKALDTLNREIELENRTKQNDKIMKMNERLEEYNSMMNKKQTQKENVRGKRFDKQEIQGTFKIGSENREILKKNYDEVSNTLILNPTRENPNIRGRREIEEPFINQHQRGNSHGFNIINHSNSNYPQKSNYGRINNMSNTNYENSSRNNRTDYNSIDMNHLNQYETKERNSENDVIANNINNQNKQINSYEDLQNLENNPYNQDTNNYLRENNTNNNKKTDEVPSEYDEAQFQKYYEEYMRQKALEDQNSSEQSNNYIYNTNIANKNPSNIQVTEGNNISETNQIPTNIKNYENHRSQIHQSQYSQNVL